MAQSTEHLFLIPVEGFFHLYHGEADDRDGIHGKLNQFNDLHEGQWGVARIEAKHDDTECVVWFTPDPDLPENPRAKEIVAEVLGWHMQFHGCVAITGMDEALTTEIIKTHG